MQDLSRRRFGAMMLAAGVVSTIPAIGRAQATGDAQLAIDEGLFAVINGMEQWVTIRGRDQRNPVMLVLHGGPGFPMSFMAPVFAAWEEHYTIVQWDQPGGGATYSKNSGRGEGPLTVERYVNDGIAVAEFIRARLGADKIVLLGTSWGTMLGVMMARRRPELFSAYVGTSQAVSGPQGALIGYRLGLDAARARGDSVAVEALERVGPPPYARFDDLLVRSQYTNPPGLPPSPEEAAAMAAQGAILSAPPPPDAHYIAQGLGPYDAWNVFLQTQRATWTETWNWEARDQGLRFAMPILIIQGDLDLNTPLELARAWFDDIQAPAKAFETIRGAGHNLFLFSDQLLALIDRHIGVAARAAASSG